MAINHVYGPETRSKERAKEKRKVRNLLSVGNESGEIKVDVVKEVQKALSGPAVTRLSWKKAFPVHVQVRHFQTRIFPKPQPARSSSLE